MKFTHTFFFLAGVMLLAVAYVFVAVPSVHAQQCEVDGTNGVCYSETECNETAAAVGSEPSFHSDSDECGTGKGCCIFVSTVVTAPTGTRATEEAGKGQTTVGYGLKNPLGSRTVPEIIGAIIGWFSGLAGALFMLYLIWGGIEWMTAGGSPDRLKSGQRKIIYAILGMVIVVLSYFIVDAIIGFTNIPPGT